MLNLSVYPRNHLRMAYNAARKDSRPMYYCPRCGRLLRNDVDRHYAIGNHLCEGVPRALSHEESEKVREYLNIPISKMNLATKNE